MPFTLLPVLDRMIELYQQPRDINRFKAYLATLTTKDGKDIELPIGVYNPMAREHVLERLQLMKELGAEEQVNAEITAINQHSDAPTDIVRVTIGLADDLGGGWTNRQSTDYQNKFRTRALLVRNFCTPIFWMSEPVDRSLVASRSREYLYRFMYQQRNGMPKTLADHVRQEADVQSRNNQQPVIDTEQLATVRALFDTSRQRDDYALIFTFLYGDAAANTFGYPPIGAFDDMGFHAARYL